MTALTAFACGFLAGLGALAALWLHDTGAPHFVAWVSSWFESSEELDVTSLNRYEQQRDALRRVHEQEQP